MVPHLFREQPARVVGGAGNGVEVVLRVRSGGKLVLAALVKALTIRVRLRIPQAGIDLRRLAARRRELGTEQFSSLMSQATSDADLAEAITSLLDQLDAANTSGT